MATTKQILSWWLCSKYRVLLLVFRRIRMRKKIYYRRSLWAESFRKIRIGACDCEGSCLGVVSGTKTTHWRQSTTLYRLPGFSCSRSRVLSAALLSCRCCRRSEVAGINIRIRKGCKWKRKLGFANCKRRHLKGVLCSSSPFAMSGLITWEPRSTKSFLLPLRGYIHSQPK